jgi:hypothetical protein
MVIFGLACRLRRVNRAIRATWYSREDGEHLYTIDHGVSNGWCLEPQILLPRIVAVVSGPGPLLRTQSLGGSTYEDSSLSRVFRLDRTDICPLKWVDNSPAFRRFWWYRV